MASFLFYILGFIMLAATLLCITRRNPVHAVIYLVVSFFALAIMFYLLGAPLVAAFEVIVYAGAIMVLFIFVVMMLNLGEKAAEREAGLLKPAMWAGPGTLALVLLVELTIVVVQGGGAAAGGIEVGPKEVALSLFGPFVIGVELASFLLMAGLVGAYYLGSGTRTTGDDG